MTPNRIPVWSWRDAIRQSQVPPLTKLVCYSLANYVSDVGTGCWPKIIMLMADTGLSNTTISTHLQNAVDAGLLEISREMRKDGRLGSNKYLPRFPATATLAAGPADMRDVHDEAENDDTPLHHVKEVHVDENHHVNLLSPPREGDALHHVKEVHVLSTSKELPKEFPTLRAGAREGGWAKGWDDATQDEVQNLAANGPTAHVAEAFVDAVRGTLNPPAHVDGPSFVRQLRTKLAKFSSDALAEAANVLTSKRARDLPAVVEIEAVCTAVAARRPKPNAPNAPVPASADPHVVAEGTAIKAELLGALGEARFRAWLTGLVCERVDGNRITVSLPTKFMASYVRDNFASAVLSAAQKSFPDVICVEVVQRQPAAAQRAA